MLSDFRSSLPPPMIKDTDLAEALDDTTVEIAKVNNDGTPVLDVSGQPVLHSVSLAQAMTQPASASAALAQIQQLSLDTQMQVMKTKALILSLIEYQLSSQTAGVISGALQKIEAVTGRSIKVEFEVPDVATTDMIGTMPNILVYLLRRVDLVLCTKEQCTPESIAQLYNAFITKLSKLAISKEINLLQIDGLILEQPKVELPTKEPPAVEQQELQIEAKEEVERGPVEEMEEKAPELITMPSEAELARIVEEEEEEEEPVT